MKEKEFDGIMSTIEDASSFVYCASKLLQIGIEHSLEHNMNAENIANGVDSFIQMSRYYIAAKVRELDFLIREQ